MDVPCFDPACPCCRVHTKKQRELEEERDAALADAKKLRDYLYRDDPMHLVEIYGIPKEE